MPPPIVQTHRLSVVVGEVGSIPPVDFHVIGCSHDVLVVDFLYPPTKTNVIPTCFYTANKAGT
jgi:hypothetical protein